MSRKTGLRQGPFVSKDHFSHNATREVKDYPNSRLIVRILDGSSLLASDLETGKSDPVCFAWYGPLDEMPSVDDMVREDQIRVLKTSVCPTTTDPIWDEELAFPIDMSSVKLADLINFWCYIFVADYDETVDPTTEAVSISYDPLGQIRIPIKDIVENGKIVNGNSLALSMRKYVLERAPAMRRYSSIIRVSSILPHDVT